MSLPYADQKAQILIDVASVFYRFVKLKKLGTVRLAPYSIQLNEKNIIHPDICFISTAKLHLIKPEGFFGVPDLIIEIPSPFDEPFELEKRKHMYEQSGVEEYWIIDPIDKNTIGFILDHGKYQSIYKGKNKVELRLPKLKIKF